MSALINELRKSFSDEDYRYGYSESFLDTYVAAQIRSLREQRGWEQQELAQRMGTKQSAVSRLENVNYSSWSVSTLKRLARVFGVRLKISFEEFATLVTDVENFDRNNLLRNPFCEDPVFGDSSRVPRIAEYERKSSQEQTTSTQGPPQFGGPQRTNGSELEDLKAALKAPACQRTHNLLPKISNPAQEKAIQQWIT